MGLNTYYTRKHISEAATGWPALAEDPSPPPTNMLGWEIYPDGLLAFLRSTARDYTGALPLFVTENGIALQGNHVRDPQRIACLDSHLAAVQQALAEDLPVKGYFLWSLLDNYEWAEGYAPRFGLVHVDFDTLERRPKSSYHALAQALGNTG